MPERSETSPAGDPRLTTSDRVFGAVGLVAVLLALAFALVGGEEDGAAGTVPPPPRISVVEPREGATVSGPVAVVFDAGEELRPSPAGWTAGDRYHLHAEIDGTELMAAPGEVQPLGGTRYRWVLPALPAGEHRIRLRWSDADHRPLGAEGSPPVRVTTR
jgi:hypothetical protein